LNRRLDGYVTESRNEESRGIDRMPIPRIIELMQREERRTIAAIESIREELVRVIETVIETFRAGGSLIYVGAGTSGRLGVLDAAECPPTFGSDPDMVRGIIAGGPEALRRSIEGAEDDRDAGREAVREQGITQRDTVIGIAASVDTPYVMGALESASRRGARTVLLTFNPDPVIPVAVNHLLNPVTGPEVIAGSTRLKAGTATKMILNMITTIAMIRMGKVYDNLMVDLRCLSDKLRDRGRRILVEVLGIEYGEADSLLERANREVKTAIVMGRLSISYSEARSRLEKTNGRVAAALGEEGRSQTALFPERALRRQVPPMTDLLAEIRKKPLRRVIGLISGTSMDGVDAALVEIREEDGFAGARLVHALTDPYDDALVLDLRSVHLAGPDRISRLNFEIGGAFAGAALRVLAEAGAGPAGCDLVGSHGQTICHETGPESGSTLQIGEPAVIVERTGIITISDFRAADVAAGGEGAPLVPLADYYLFRPDRGVRLLLNIGGIANLTILTPERSGVRGFDTGPGNALIDAAVRLFSGGSLSYDQDGERARRGRPHTGMLAEMMAHPFLRKPPPRSTGLDTFGDAYVGQLRDRYPDLSMEDFLSTLTHFTALSIAAAVKESSSGSEVEETIGVGGGGVHNRYLMEILSHEVAPYRLDRIDSLGIPAEYREAVAFAILANETIEGRPGNITAVTGSGREVVLGRVSFPTSGSGGENL
jgi:N-acetylmuramic acid 6-phosphate etherase